MGHVGLIQRNALASWTHLQPRPDIILFGNETGTAEAAREFGARHVPEIARTPFGTPYVSDIFAQAQRLAQHETLCFVNCDIIFLSDFGRAVRRISRRQAPFLIVGQRWDVDMDKPMEFGVDWEQRLKTMVCRHGSLHPPAGSDYFVFRRGLWDQLPSFAVGRIGYDNWLLSEARRQNLAVIDATPEILAIHQNHDYAHLPKGTASIEDGPEAKHNIALMGDNQRRFTIEDATWIMGRYGVVPAITRRHIRRRLSRWLDKHPGVKGSLRRLRHMPPKS